MDLADLTTLRLGGPARTVVEAHDEAGLVERVRTADSAGGPVLLVAGGSNLVVADEGFDGMVVRVLTRGIDVRSHDPETVTVTVPAGEDWDLFVARAVAEGWSGVEALAGIPGSVGATPVQNVGAYGQEVAQTITAVRVFDRSRRTVATLPAAECGFGYRHSRFKAEPDRFVVLEVTFRLRRGPLGAPVRYAELARTLGVESGQPAPAEEVRETVLGLRRGKGMLLDPGDHDTWSAGSFFTNPLLSTEQAAGLPDGAPRFDQPDGRVKTSAAWLIEAAGFARGYGDGRVRLSTKHTLALTNRGGATTAELLGLAREIRDGVRTRFGVALVPEPTLLGCSL